MLTFVITTRIILAFLLISLGNNKYTVGLHIKTKHLNTEKRNASKSLTYCTVCPFVTTGALLVSDLI